MKHLSVLFTVITALLLTAFSAAAQDATPEATTEAGEQASILFTHTGDEGTLTAADDGTYTLTLENVDTQVLWFSDRPARGAGYLTLDGYLQVWGEGSDSFESDPPNASVIIDGQGVAVELLNPVYDEAAGTLSYTATLLDDSTSFPDGATLDAPVIFIDGWISEAVTGVSCLGALAAPEAFGVECYVGLLETGSDS